jgi:hypothetical protein
MGTIETVRVEPRPVLSPNQRDEKSQPLSAAAYRNAFDESGGTMHLQPTFRLDLTLVEVKYYATLQNFYQSVRSADDEAVVLSRPPSTVAL